MCGKQSSAFTCGLGARQKKDAPAGAASRLVLLAVSMQWVCGSTRALACSDQRPRWSAPVLAAVTEWSLVDVPAVFREGACAPHFNCRVTA
jgi:hypothetical protein